MVNTNVPINDEVIKKLRTLIKEYYQKLRLVPSIFQNFPLTSLCGLWDRDSLYQKKEYDQNRDTFNNTDIDGEALYKDFISISNEIFKEDKHLSICCGEMPINLATSIDLYCLSSINYTGTLIGNELNDKHINKHIDTYISKIYEEHYKRFAIFHLFNLKIDDDIDLKFGNWSIKKIPREGIPAILGESTPFSRLHYPDVGNDFLVFVDSEKPNDSYTWIKNKYEEAQEIEQILQFIKDKTISIDYYTFYFTPKWVNQIWRMGNFYYGNVRTISPQTKYTIQSQEIGNIKNYWNLYNNNISKFKTIEESNLGQVIQRAGRHFYIYHTKDIKEEKFINLIIALEVLFSPKAEVNYRISQCAAIFISGNNQGIDIFNFIKKMLNLRNELVHGGYDLKKIEQDKFIMDDDLYKLASIIRRAILGFIVLFLRGEDKKDEIIKKIESSIFNFKVRKELIKSSNIDDFIKENLKKE